MLRLALLAAPVAGPVAGLALLAGCASVPPPAIEAAPAPLVPPAPPGMELLLQQPMARAIALLGQPRFDKKEGESRQLQFGGACILDLWYYPAPGGLVATYAEARLPDGDDLAAGACLRLLLPDGTADGNPAGPAG